MNLHTNEDLFLELVQATSEALEIQEIFIEKDYWVTFALKNLAEWDADREVVFKGGTSLSKAYKAINRFSEDVDLVLKNTSLNPSQIKTRLKAVHKNVIQPPLKEISTHRTSKGSRFRKSDCFYPQILDDYQDRGEVSGHLLIELNSFGNPFPTEVKKVNSYIAEFLENSGRDDLVSENGLESFELEVLDLKRTFCEKLMSLLRLSFKEDYLSHMRAKVRHFYDLSALYQRPEIMSFVQSENFIQSLRDIYADDMRTPEFQTDWKTNSIANNPFVLNLDEILEAIRVQYGSTFRPLLYSREKTSIEEIEARLRTIVTVLEMTVGGSSRCKSFSDV